MERHSEQDKVRLEESDLPVIEPVEYGEIRYFRMARRYFGRLLHTTGVFWVDGLLFDSGPPNISREFARLSRELAIRLSVTTHHHEDHVGNHATLRRMGIPLFAHSTAIPRLAHPPERLHLYRRLAWGTPEAALAQPLGPEIATRQLRFQVIHTPGHAEDHVALFEPNRGWLFTGDLYLGPYLRYLRADEDVYALMDSLRRLLTLDFREIYCQHRGQVEDGRRMLARKLAFLEELAGRVLALHQEGFSEAAIAGKLFSGDRFWRFFTGGHFSRRNFVRAFLKKKAA